jgi:hypothetical protein
MMHEERKLGVLGCSCPEGFFDYQLIDLSARQCTATHFHRCRSLNIECPAERLKSEGMWVNDADSGIFGACFNFWVDFSS